MAEKKKAKTAGKKETTPVEKKEAKAEKKPAPAKEATVAKKAEAKPKIAQPEKEPKKEAEKKGKKAEAKKEEEKKPVKKKKKKIIEKIVNPKKPKEIQAMRDLIKKKQRRMFRGRFGQRNRVRNISKKKWQKWRKPHGMDIQRRKPEDGLVVRIGFRTPKKIRGRHPSGFKEIVVNNAAQLENAAKNKENAIKIARTVGLRKRNELLKKAKELKVWVLNA